MISSDLQVLISQLEITTRKHVSGPLLGDAVSRLKGSGFEFNQLREYIQGDDIRFIDWKASARSNKTLVRQYLEDRNRTMYIVADVSASMDYGTVGQTKADFIKQLGAMLAFVALHSKDSLGLILFSDEVEVVMSPRKSRSHTLGIINKLFTHTPKHRTTNLSAVFEYLARIRGQRAIVCFLSDFMGELSGPMMRVAPQKHDIMAFRCLDPKEKRFPPVGTLMFEDRETGQRVDVAGGQGAALEKALGRWHDQQRDRLVGARIDTLDIELGAPYIGDLLRFLRQRMVGRR